MSDILKYGPMKPIFEEQVEFRDREGFSIRGGVFIGETEFLPMQILGKDEDAYHAEFNRWLYESWLPEKSETRSQILGLHANRRRYEDLLEAVRRRQVIPLVGSGLSAPSGLPLWAELLRAIRLFTKAGETELEFLISIGKFEEAADLLERACNRRLLNERIEHELRLEETRAVVGAVRLLPAIFTGAVLTTNLDVVLERNYSNAGRNFDHVLAGREIADFRSRKGQGVKCLLKLHGDCRKMDTRVLLPKEYAEAYSDGGLIRGELALLYRYNNILFLGCSLGNDRTVQLIAEISVSDTQMPPHYAFLELPKSDSARLDREQFLTERGIFPIWYDGPHDEALTALLAGLICENEDGS